MNFRLRNNQRLKDPGSTAFKDDAAKATYNNGTAQRTDSCIIDETPSALERSMRNMVSTISMDIGVVISQNRFQPLMALIFSKSSKFALVASVGISPYKRFKQLIVQLGSIFICLTYGRGTWQILLGQY